MSEPVRLMPIEEFKRRLGPFAAQLSDAELLKLRDDAYKLADAVIDWWLRYRHTKNADSTNAGTES